MAVVREQEQIKVGVVVEPLEKQEGANKMDIIEKLKTNLARYKELTDEEQEILDTARKEDGVLFLIDDGNWMLADGSSKCVNYARYRLLGNYKPGPKLIESEVSEISGSLRNEKMRMPDDTKASLDRYVKEKIPTGGFLYAVLTNDLFEAVGRADIQNRHALFEICRYIYNELPLGCWGSVEKVSNWLGKE